ncbi:MAG: hypothetical protein M9962_15155 [Oligoflexia bacterium]|nr:hypothetical protein [Oligoflexia bacterium]
MLLLLFFINLSFSFATTKAVSPGQQPIRNNCKLEAVFLKPSFKNQSIVKNGKERIGHWVYWDVAIKNISTRQNCPTEKEISIRIRAADYSIQEGNKIITYPVDVYEPKVNDVINLSIYFIQGKDTYLNKKYAEWTLHEVLE